MILLNASCKSLCKFLIDEDRFMQFCFISFLLNALSFAPFQSALITYSSKTSYNVNLCKQYIQVSKLIQGVVNKYYLQLYFLNILHRRQMQVINNPLLPQMQKLRFMVSSFLCLDHYIFCL